MKATIYIEGQSYSSFPNLVQNDYGWPIRFLVTYNDSTVVDLTGATVRFKTKSVELGSAVKINGLCTLTTPAEGDCQYTLIATDLDTVGSYETELEVTLAGPVVHTVKFGKIQVVEDIE